jgi:hypothetical protein
MYKQLEYISTVRRDHYFRVKDSGQCIKYLCNNLNPNALTLVDDVPQVKPVTYRYLGFHDFCHVYLDESSMTWYQMVIHDGCGPPPTRPQYMFPAIDWPATSFRLRRIDPVTIKPGKKTYRDIQLDMYSDGIAEYRIGDAGLFWTLKWRDLGDGIDLWLIGPDMTVHN